MSVHPVVTRECIGDCLPNARDLLLPSAEVLPQRKLFQENASALANTYADIPAYANHRHNFTLANRY